MTTCTSPKPTYTTSNTKVSTTRLDDNEEGIGQPSLSYPDNSTTNNETYDHQWYCRFGTGTFVTTMMMVTGCGFVILTLFGILLMYAGKKNGLEECESPPCHETILDGVICFVVGILCLAACTFSIYHQRRRRDMPSWHRQGCKATMNRKIIFSPNTNASGA